MSRMHLPHDQWLDTLLAQSLREDIGTGDASTAVTVDPAARATARVIAREPGVMAGLPLVVLLFARLDEAVSVILEGHDGDHVQAGQAVAVLRGPAAALLTGERTALNFLQQLSGIATLTARYVDAVRGTACRVLDTRKTVPGWRALAKYAVRCGGGTNHRLGLYDRIMIKDNHWVAADPAGTGGQRVTELVARGRRDFPALAIEVEVDSLAQLDAVLPLRVEWVLLDNFTPDEVREAVARRDVAAPGTLLESSGNITLETIADFARAGVDACSVGRLTHSAPALDLALDLELEA